MGKNWWCPFNESSIAEAVRHEIQEGGNKMDSWQQLDIKLEETLNKLDLLGYNAKVLKCKVGWANKNSLESRVPASASEEEKIKALAKHGSITLSTVFFTVGTQYLNTDTMFQMMAYMQRKKDYAIALAAYKKSIGEKRYWGQN
jgi:hypothetical protein